MCACPLDSASSDTILMTCNLPQCPYLITDWPILQVRFHFLKATVRHLLGHFTPSRCLSKSLVQGPSYLCQAHGFFRKQSLLWCPQPLANPDQPTFWTPESLCPPCPFYLLFRDYYPVNFCTLNLASTFTFWRTDTS